MENKRVLIKRKFVNLIIVSFVISVLLFTIIHYAVKGIMNNYFNSESYNESQRERIIEEFSKYVKKNNISTTDRKTIRHWVENEKYLIMSIFKDNVLVYDSTYTLKEEDGYYNEIESQYESLNSKTVIFSDGKADVLVFGYYTLKYYDAAFMIEFMVLCIIFLAMVLSGIKRKMQQIQKLNEEIHILEGGNLEYAITVKGNDELSMLAKSVEELRSAFICKLKLIDDLQKESRGLVTEISHDMRTPLTAILMYLGFAKDATTIDDSETKEYINKAYDKAISIKNLSDQMFEYFLLDKEEILKLEVISFTEAFYDSISDMVAFLRSKDYIINENMVFPDVKIMVSREYIRRILNNLISNIMKYADEEVEITISCIYDGQTIELHFRNKSKPVQEEQESTGLGLKIVEKMMNRMLGQYIILKQYGYFESIIKFSIAEKSYGECSIADTSSSKHWD